MNFDSIADFDAQTRAAYDRWAANYPAIAHNPLMRAEQRAMRELWPEVRGRRTLDLGCGSGRYAKLLAQDGAAEVFAIDFSMPMLTQVTAAQRVCAGMPRLPLADGGFDTVICGLAIGHAADLDAWMREAARVLAPGGCLLYSDFHAQAARAGLRRTFKHDGRECTVPHRCYPAMEQRSAAVRAGLTLEDEREVRVGYEITEVFADSNEFYERWHGLPLVLVVRLRK